MKLSGLLTTLPILMLSSSAFAASQPDLGVTLSAPPGIHVDETGRYTAMVNNTGNKNAAGVTLTIQLPRTATSPTVHVMGTLGARDSRCVLSGTSLVCTLGTIARNRSTSVFFDLALPYSTGALAISAAVTTTTLPESNPFNNSTSHTATPLLYATTVTGPLTADHRSCAGSNLSSFFECALYPSSIQAFEAVFNADTSITLIDAPPGYTGTWTFTGPDQLHVEYFYGGQSEASIETRSVGGGCFEGPMYSGGWTIMYEICLH